MAAAIKAGFYTIGIGAGVETMSQNPMAWEGGVNPRVAESQNAQNCLVPMGAPRTTAQCKAFLCSGSLRLKICIRYTTALDPQIAGLINIKIICLMQTANVGGLSTWYDLQSLFCGRRDVRECGGQVQHLAGGAGQVCGAVARARGGGALFGSLRRPDCAGAHGLEGPQDWRGEARHHLRGVRDSNLVSISIYSCCMLLFLSARTEADVCRALLGRMPRFVYLAPVHGFDLVGLS